MEQYKLGMCIFILKKTLLAPRAKYKKKNKRENICLKSSSFVKSMKTLVIICPNLGRALYRGQFLEVGPKSISLRSWFEESADNCELTFLGHNAIIIHCLKEYPRHSIVSSLLCNHEFPFTVMP